MSLSRRTFLHATTTLSLGAAIGAPIAAAARAAPAAAAAGDAPARRRRGTLVVVGAGAFGGWTALHALRRGFDVTLVDAWGPGNSRSSSGGDTRVTRAIYGARRLYVDWVADAVGQWRDLERVTGSRLYTRTGTLWMFQGDDEYARSSLPHLADAGLTAVELSLAAARERFPQVDLAGVSSVFVEEEAGFLAARRACHEVARRFVQEGGEYRHGQVVPVYADHGDADGSIGSIRLADGGRLAADAFVFACGPWLGRALPDAIGPRVRPSRQEVYFFGTPPGDRAFSPEVMPTWVDFGERVFYGIPGNESRGFKLADDTHGPTVDPTTLERIPDPATLATVRAFMERRFPALAGAPLLENRVCQYENSPDGDLIIDRHPALADVWIAGGGSGHGFKLGPAVGRHVAGLVDGDTRPVDMFRLDRRTGAPGGAGESQFRGGDVAAGHRPSSAES